MKGQKAIKLISWNCIIPEKLSAFSNILGKQDGKDEHKYHWEPLFLSMSSKNRLTETTVWHYATFTRTFTSGCYWSELWDFFLIRPTLSPILFRVFFSPIPSKTSLGSLSVVSQEFYFYSSLFSSLFFFLLFLYPSILFKKIVIY